MDPNEIRLLAEQLNHAVDLLKARIDLLEARQAQQEQLGGLRLGALERSQEDQETRLRAVADSVTRLTTSTSLAQAAQAGFAIILSALAAWLGRR